MSAIKESLLENSKSAIISCIEIHNKPIFSYRYEITSILLINSWELLLKAYIAEYHPEVRIIKKDGTTKTFEECVSFVSSQLSNNFRHIEENLLKIYDFRCNVIHFYKDKIDSILYSLIHKSVYFYNEFLKKHFNDDLSEETNLILLPIGFKPFASPIDFLTDKSLLKESSKAVHQFVKSLIETTEKLNEEGIEESIMTGFKVAVINENRVKNADIIAGITKDPAEAKVFVNKIFTNGIANDKNAQKVQIDEESLFKTIFILTYSEMIKKCRLLYTDFKQGAKFNKIISELKNNPEIHRCRFLDINKKTGVGKSFYSVKVFEELNKHYTLKSNSNNENFN